MICRPVERAGCERGLFFAVADGMGGHAAAKWRRDGSQTAAIVSMAPDDDLGAALRGAGGTANAAVYEAGAGTTGRDHMGSTLTAVVLANRHIVVGHVGDSRCYVVRRGAIEQLSRDHSWVAEEVAAGLLTEEQARVHPRRNIITRALGCAELTSICTTPIWSRAIWLWSVRTDCGLVTDAEICRT